MAERTPDWNPPEELTPEWIAHVDKLYPSPADQANTILAQIRNPWEDTWALIFFAVETLGNVALPMIGPGSDLAIRIRELGRDFYGLHYFMAPEIYEVQRVAEEIKESPHGIHPIAEARVEGNGVPEASPDESDD